MKATSMMEVSQSGPQDQQTIQIRGERYRERVRALNDAFRHDPIGNIGVSNRMLITKGVSALGPNEMEHVIKKVTAFDDFSEDNDPWSEHDFGAFDHDGERIFWKIDYYNRDGTGASRNPADPSVTCRVLTVMLASEY